MRFYTGQHAFYCGIDLHARVMYLCVMDQGGKILLHKNLPAEADVFLKAIAPYRADVVVAVECIFTWYWIADLCGREGIPFVLGHALYMKAIHGGKTKNDKIDSQKIAALLRGGMLPMAYTYPQGMRSTRDLLPRRMYLVHQRFRASRPYPEHQRPVQLPGIRKEDRLQEQPPGDHGGFRRSDGAKKRCGGCAAHRYLRHADQECGAGDTAQGSPA